MPQQQLTYETHKNLKKKKKKKKIKNKAHHHQNKSWSHNNCTKRDQIREEWDQVTIPHDDAEKVINEPHGSHTLKIAPA